MEESYFNFTVIYIINVLFFRKFKMAAGKDITRLYKQEIAGLSFPEKIVWIDPQIISEISRMFFSYKIYRLDEKSSKHVLDQ